jgi:hypothetical protein
MRGFTLLNFPKQRFVKTNVKPDIGSSILFTLLMITFIYLTIVMGKKSRLEDDLKDELLTAELLLSEKLLEQKENAALKIDLTHLEQKNVQAQNRIDSILTLLSEGEEVIRRARSGILQQTIRDQRQIIQALNCKLDEDSLETIQKIFELDSVNQRIEKELIGSTIEKENLVDEIERLSMLKINDALVEALNKRKKLTANAIRIKQLKAIIQISDQVQDLRFKIIEPNGKEMILTSANFSIEIKDPAAATESHAFFISPEIQLSALTKLRQVEITYRFDAKPSPGLYNISAFSGSYHIGSLRARMK